jgi:hypothetical protein
MYFVPTSLFRWHSVSLHTSDINCNRLNKQLPHTRTDMLCAVVCVQILKLSPTLAIRQSHDDLTRGPKSLSGAFCILYTNNFVVWEYSSTCVEE